MKIKKLLSLVLVDLFGYNLCEYLISKCKVVGIDNLDNYYNVNIKKKRLNLFKKNFKFSN